MGVHDARALSCMAMVRLGRIAAVSMLHQKMEVCSSIVSAPGRAKHCDASQLRAIRYPFMPRQDYWGLLT